MQIARRRHRFIVCFAVASTLNQAGRVEAAPPSATWDGNASVGVIGDAVYWSDATNWTSNGVIDSLPVETGGGSDLTFGSGTVGTIRLDASRTIRSITFNNGFTLGDAGSSDSITLSTGAIQVNASARIASPIVGTSGLTINGTDKLYLDRTLGYSGNTNINGGDIRINSGATLSGQFNVASGAAMLFSGVNLTVNNTAGNSGSFSIDAGSEMYCNGFTQSAGTLGGLIHISDGQFNNNGGSINGTITLTNRISPATLNFGATPASGGVFKFTGKDFGGFGGTVSNITGTTDSATTTMTFDPESTGSYSLNFPGAGTFSLHGNLNLNSTFNNSNITVNAGTILNSGSITVNPSIGGTGTRTINATLTSAGVMNFNADTRIAGPSITNNGQMNISSSTLQLAPTSTMFTNNGTIVLTGSATGSNSSGLQVLYEGNPAPLPSGLLNNGVLQVDAGNALTPGLRTIYAQPINYGTMNINSPTVVSGGFVENPGTLNIATGTNLDLEKFYLYPMYFANGGTINGGGKLRFRDSDGRFLMDGGAVNASVELIDGNLLAFNGPGPFGGTGTFTFVGQLAASLPNTFSQTISGAIPAGLTVRLRPENSDAVKTSTLIAPADFVNNGTFVLEAQSQNHNLIVTGTTFTNNGTVRILPTAGGLGTGTRVFQQTTFTNNGTLAVATATRLSTNNLVNNGLIDFAGTSSAAIGIGTGTFTINPGSSMNQGVGGFVFVDGGTVIDNGSGSAYTRISADNATPTLAMSSSVPSNGKYTYVGKAVSGSPSTWNITGDGHLLPTASIDISPAYIPAVTQNTIVLSGTMVNAGTVSLSASYQNHGITISGAGAIKNQGVFDINPGPTGDGVRQINVPYENDGNVTNINASTTFQSLTMNSGVANVAAGKTLTSIQSTQFRSGTITLAGSAGSPGVLSTHDMVFISSSSAVSQPPTIQSSPGANLGYVDLGGATRTIDVQGLPGNPNAIHGIISAPIVNGGVIKTGAGNLVVSRLTSNQPLTVAAGKLQIVSTSAPASSANVLSSLSVNTAAGGKLDITNNAIVIRSIDTSNTARNAIRSLITSAMNNFDNNGQVTWDGPGILSSTARSSNITASVDVYTVAVISNHDLIHLAGGPGSEYGTGNPWLGTVSSIGTDDLLLRMTYSGDTNLDGTVTIDDYNAIDGTVLGLTSNFGWVSGDFDFNGVINIDDYNAIDTGFLYQGGQLSQSMIASRNEMFGADYVAHLEQLATAFATVPEPASLGAFTLAAAGLLVRRRGRLGSRK